MSKRLSRKEIKHDIREDELQTRMVSVVDRLAANPRLVTGLAIALLALALLAAGAVSYVDHQRNQASAVLARALETADAPIVESDAKPDDPKEPSFASEEERRAKTLEAMGKVPRGLGGAAAGEVAELYEARLALDEGDTARAREVWEAFLRDHGDDLLAISVRVNLIHLDRAEGRGEQVAESLRADLDNPKKHLPEDVLIVELARTLQSLDREDEARTLYQRLIDEHPSSPFVAEAHRMVS